MCLRPKLTLITVGIQLDSALVFHSLYVCEEDHIVLHVLSHPLLLFVQEGLLQWMKSLDWRSSGGKMQQWKTLRG